LTIVFRRQADLQTLFEEYEILVVIHDVFNLAVSFGIPHRAVQQWGPVGMAEPQTP
jgi:hypothetical protein